MKKTIFDITIKKDGTTIGTLVRADIVEFGGAVDDYNISSTGVVESVKANGYGTYNIVLKLQEITKGSKVEGGTNYVLFNCNSDGAVIKPIKEVLEIQ